ncbi:MAG: hypothetical protein GY747_05360 [Planctomycetes bacterium]|nr:hypothetical protein [Planctomycetota bacterium]MCP4770363.1 hypothetical protein [Planctomycetota bacterium]MCP4860545.1 hypothetical protein [Planctomycetota bacterium]
MTPVIGRTVDEYSHIFDLNAAREDPAPFPAFPEIMRESPFRGHALDLGLPQINFAAGVGQPDGTGSFTSLPVPGNAAGMTVYFEVLTSNQAGILFESNSIAVTFQWGEASGQ